MLRANDIEVRLYPLLMEMRRNGFPIDVKRTIALGDEFTGIVDKGIEEISLKYGINDFSLNSSNDIEKIWKAEGLPVEYTAKGKPSFTSEILAECTHPVAHQIMYLRGLVKTLSFLNGWIDLEYNGRLHSVFYPAKRDDGGTVTGRWSSQSPNLQQVSAREDKHGPEVRGLFIPEEGCYLGAFDYKQIEYRTFIHFAQGEGAVEAQKQFSVKEIDYHQMVQEMMGWITEDKIQNKLYRHITKNLNFTCISPDSFIATRRGYIRAKELKNDDLLVLDSGKWRAFIGRKPQYRFTLSNGQQFCVTTDHPFKLFGKEVGASTLKVGDKWDVVPNRFWGDIQQETIKYTYHRREWECKLTIDEDFAYLLGVWLGDGCVHMQYKTGEPSSISFCTPPENTSLLKQIVGGKTTTSRISDKWEVWCYTSKPLAKWILENCGRTVTKHVPDVIYRSPRNVMVAFMRGFLDSDGTVYNNKPQFVNTNEGLMRGLARCAAMLGWKARWSQENYNAEGCTGILYRLVFHPEDITQLELQGIVRTWHRDVYRKDSPVTITNIEEIGEQDTFCVSLPPPHWYEAECCINHNSLYGMGPRSFAARFKIPLMNAHPDADPDNLVPLATSLMNEYFRKVPFVKPTCNKIMDVGQRRGYVRTLSGKRQRMPLDNGVYKLINYLIQGSAADLLKKGLVDAWEKGVFNILKIHATVHDEVVFSLPQTKEAMEAAITLKECLSNAYEMKIPIGVDTEIGNDWGHCEGGTWNEFCKRYS